MTVVTVTRWQPSTNNTVGARGYLRWEPTKARDAAPGLIVPLPFTVALVNGTASVTVDPTGVGWAWGVTFQLLGLKHETFYYLVPNSASAVDIDTLTKVNPLTLAAGATPDPAWYAYVDSIAAGQVGKVAVVTGSEPRPAFGTVLWIGGTIQPVNMAASTDIWFKATA